MANQKLQVGRGLAVIPSNTIDIPFPGAIKQEQSVNTSTGGGGFNLIDTAALFVTNNISVGDIIYNTTDSTCAKVVSVTSETQLVCNSAIFAASGKKYFVYDRDGNDGCVLYVGGAGTLSVRTVGGDTLNLAAVSAGQFIPIQVLGVNTSNTSATGIIALW